MSIKKLWKTGVLLSALLCGSMAATAQTGGNFEIKQSVIAPGGGRTAGGNYTVDATIAQTIAGDQSASGNMTEQTGYWAGGVVPVAIPQAKPFDFDGDGKTDISIFRPSAGEWWYLRSSDLQ